MKSVRQNNSDNWETPQLMSDALHSEKQDIDERIDTLRHTFDIGGFSSLPDDELWLIKDQLKYMQSYSRKLGQRIELKLPKGIKGD